MSEDPLSAVLSSSWPLLNESDSVLLWAGWMAGTLHEPALGHPLSDLGLTRLSGSQRSLLVSQIWTVVSIHGPHLRLSFLAGVSLWR